MFSLYLQYDTELFNKILEISGEYKSYYDAIMRTKDAEENVDQEATKRSDAIWPKVIEVQEIINKRLEEL